MGQPQAPVGTVTDRRCPSFIRGKSWAGQGWHLERQARSASTPRRPGIALSPGTGTTTASAVRWNAAPRPRRPPPQRCGRARAAGAAARAGPPPARRTPPAAAARRLALRARARFDTGGDITPDTRVSVLAEAWFTG